jgi:hypothetical protein
VKVDLVFTYGPISTIDYYVPSLGVDVSASGPLARRVVNTLTRSPRTVAMAPGSAPTVPSWQTMTFQGLSFAAPGTWQVMRTSDNLGIGYPCTTPGVALVGQRGIVLSTDQQLAVYHCPGVRPLSLTPQEGVQVDVGSHTLSQWNLHIVFSTHCLSLHGLTACPATSPAYSILVLKVTVPGRNKPVYVSIGLAGNGMVARTILYSLRASPAIGHPLQVAGTIAGTLVRVGGPSPGAPVALPGQVTARSSAGRRFTVTVGKNGKFVLSVSPGEYKLTGHSPLVSQETCMATKPVRVKTGQRVSGVEVICSIS